MMNNFDKHLLPGCHQGDDPELDCPNANCTGYLNLYLYNNNNNPAYLQCSNKHNPIPSLRCEQATIFSRRPGMCPYCHKEIRFKDIITPGWEHDWIHLACAYKNTQPDNIFARCLRCNQNIATAADASPSFNAGMSGFIHLHCMKGKKGNCSAVLDTDLSTRPTQHVSSSSQQPPRKKRHLPSDSDDESCVGDHFAEIDELAQ
jgi:hypothetical protein